MTQELNIIFIEDRDKKVFFQRQALMKRTQRVSTKAIIDIPEMLKKSSDEIVHVLVRERLLRSEGKTLIYIMPEIKKTFIKNVLVILKERAVNIDLTIFHPTRCVKNRA